MDIQEELRSAIHRIDERYFLEEVTHTHSRDVDYWLGSYGSEQRFWLGSEERMTRQQAIARAEEMVNRLEK